MLHFFPFSNFRKKSCANSLSHLKSSRIHQKWDHRFYGFASILFVCLGSSRSLFWLWFRKIILHLLHEKTRRKWRKCRWKGKYSAILFVNSILIKNNFESDLNLLCLFLAPLRIASLCRSTKYKIENLACHFQVWKSGYIRDPNKHEFSHANFREKAVNMFMSVYVAFAWKRLREELSQRTMKAHA